MALRRVGPVVNPRGSLRERLYALADRMQAEPIEIPGQAPKPTAAVRGD